MTTTTTAVVNNSSRIVEFAKAAGTMMITGSVIGAGVGTGILATGAVLGVGLVVVGGIGMGADLIKKKLDQRKARENVKTYKTEPQATYP